MSLDWVGGLFKWIIHRAGASNLIQICLLWLILGSAGCGLAAVVLRLESNLLLAITFFCVLIGWLLAHTRLRGWTYGLIGIALGLFSLLLTVGHLGRPLVILVSNLALVLGQLLQRHPTDFSATAAAWQVLQGAELNLLTLFSNWFGAIRSNTPAIDSTVTSLLWGMTFWLAVFWAVWWVKRREFTLVGLIPMIGLLGYNIYYTNSLTGTHWLVLTVGGTLALQAASSYRSWRRGWIARRLDQVDIELMLAISVVLFAGGMMLAGNFLPSVSIQKISDAVDRIIHIASGQTVAESLGLEQTPAGDLQPGAPQSGVNPGKSHALGPAPVLNQDIVLRVKVDGYTPPPPMDEYTIRQPIHNVIYYWSAQTYDSYSGHEWTASFASQQQIGAGQPILPDIDAAALPANFRLVTQHVTRLQAGIKITFFAGELLSLDQPATILRGDSGDIVSVSTASDSYTAFSRIQSASAKQLQGAVMNYPPSIRHYLTLPDELPQRVRDLALELTAGKPTPFDRAEALEDYLRQIPYSLTIPGPPSNQDAVDYFLFNQKTGFCDYYASAMVVMARVAGLPARLVIGYSSGFYDMEQKAFIVRASNAHAWPEIYFPDLGWVQFEPTPVQPLPDRTGQESAGGQPVQLSSPGQTAPLSFGPFKLPLLGSLIGILLVAVALLMVALLLPLETWWLSLLSADEVLKVIFRRLYRRGRSLGLPLDPSRTPHEFALALSTRLEKPTNTSKQAAAIDLLHADLDWLTGLYARLLFSEHPPNSEEKEKAIQTWHRLRRRMRKIRIFREYFY
jgi:hypothetical protein